MHAVQTWLASEYDLYMYEVRNTVFSSSRLTAKLTSPVDTWPLDQSIVFLLREHPYIISFFK